MMDSSQCMPSDSRKTRSRLRNATEVQRALSSRVSRPAAAAKHQSCRFPQASQRLTGARPASDAIDGRVGSAPIASEARGILLSSRDQSRWAYRPSRPELGSPSAIMPVPLLAVNCECDSSLQRIGRIDHQFHPAGIVGKLRRVGAQTPFFIDRHRAAGLRQGDAQ